MRNAVMIVGCGMMGSGIAAMAALAGNRTILVDVDETKVAAGYERVKQCISLRRQNGLCSGDVAAVALSKIETTIDLPDSSKEARLVIEAIVEDLEIKQKMFKQLDSLLPPEVPICSNTSGLQITQISLFCKHPERTLTTHFWLPAHLVPLVEVVMGEHTDEQIATSVVEELKIWKKAPVLVRRDLPGQLANRIFQAIIRESIAIVASGLASAEDVDTAIGCGMAMRFPVWGPLKHLDAIGLNLGLSVQDTVLPSISNEQAANQYLCELVASGNLGVSTGTGFYDWSEYDIHREIEKRDAFIIEAVKLKARMES